MPSSINVSYFQNKTVALHTSNTFLIYISYILPKIIFTIPNCPYHFTNYSQIPYIKKATSSSSPLHDKNPVFTTHYVFHVLLKTFTGPEHTALIVYSPTILIDFLLFLIKIIPATPLTWFVYHFFNRYHHMLFVTMTYCLYVFHF